MLRRVFLIISLATALVALVPGEPTRSQPEAEGRTLTRYAYHWASVYKRQPREGYEDIKVALITPVYAYCPGPDAEAAIKEDLEGMEVTFAQDIGGGAVLSRGVERFMIPTHAHSSREQRVRDWRREEYGVGETREGPLDVAACP